MAPAISTETQALAIEIADEAARCDIESHCRVAEADGATWYTTAGHPDMDEYDWVCVRRAARYLEERGRLERHGEIEHLVRFLEASAP